MSGCTGKKLLEYVLVHVYPRLLLPEWTGDAQLQTTLRCWLWPYAYWDRPCTVRYGAQAECSGQTGLLWLEMGFVGHQLGLARGLLWAHPDQNWPRDTNMDILVRPIPLLIRGQNGYTTHIMLVPICIQSNCRGASTYTQIHVMLEWCWP